MATAGSAAGCAAMASTAQIVGDRLYGIDFRPQELALHGERVRFDLRCSVIADEMDVPAEQHWKLLVMQVFAPLTEALAKQHGTNELLLLKCGWELELRAEPAVAARALADTAEELRLLLSRIADTVNDLARRAGLEAPLGPALVDSLLAELLTPHVSG